MVSGKNVLLTPYWLATFSLNLDFDLFVSTRKYVSPDFWRKLFKLFSFNIYSLTSRLRAYKSQFSLNFENLRNTYMYLFLDTNIMSLKQKKTKQKLRKNFQIWSLYLRTPITIIYRAKCKIIRQIYLYQTKQCALTRLFSFNYHLVLF